MPPKNKKTAKKAVVSKKVPKKAVTRKKTEVKKKAIKKASVKKVKKSIAKKATKSKAAKKSPTEKKAVTSKKIKKAKKIAVHSTTLNSPKQKWERRLMYFLIIIILLSAGVILYRVSPTFRNNFKGFASVMHNWNEIAWDNIEDFKMIIDKDSADSNVLVKADIVTCNECDTHDIEERFENEIENDVFFSTFNNTSDEGKYLIKKFEIKSVPMIVFDEGIKNTPFYEKYGEMMEQKEGKYLLYGPPVLFVKPPNHAGSYFKGENGEITVYGYFSFSDPHSKMAAEGLDKIIKENPSSRAYFKHFIRTDADLLPANAVECAGSQGVFWPVHNRLFENQNNLNSTADVINIVKDIPNIDSDALAKCIDDRVYSSKIERDSAEAEEYGIDSAPAFIINGHEKRNIYTYEDFAEIFNKILSKHKITDDTPMWGDPSSKIIIVEYSDFQCPFSAKYATEILPKLKEKYSEKVLYVKKDFPLTNLYKNSMMASQAARCADKQNFYWEMYKDLYDNQVKWYTEENVNDIFVEMAKNHADEIQFNENYYRSCLEDQGVKSDISNDFQTGKKIGVQATPTIFIQSPKGEQKIEGLLSYKDFERILDQIIEDNE